MSGGGGFSGGGSVPPEGERDGFRNSPVIRFVNQAAKGWLRGIILWAIVGPVVCGGIVLLLWALGATRF